MKNILRKLITDCTEEYCCLCLETVKELDRSFRIRDEIRLEIEGVEDIYEILFTVLGENVMNLLPTNTICTKCTYSVINSYKFIELCKKNILGLSGIISWLQNYVANYAIEQRHCKSLLIVIDGERTNKVFSTKSSRHTPQAFAHIQKKNSMLQNGFHLITLDIKNEPENYDDGRTIQSTVNEVNVCSSKTKNLYEPVAQSEQNLNIPNQKFDKNDLKCKDCLKVYQSDKKLKMHYLRVHAPKCFKCPKCPRSFGIELLLNHHIKQSHCIAVCSCCGRTYNNKYSLRHHEKIHHSSKRLVCQTCGKVYKGKQSFNNHVEQNLCEKIRKANSTAKLKCKYCDKKYTHNSALNVHLRLEHENGKSLICDWCGKKLSSESRLKEHIIKHTKQKNYHCDTCGGKFVTKMSLLYHIRTHTGEKPYKCEHCDLKFLSASRRSEHVKQIHAGPDLECEICHGKYKGQTRLKRHRKRHFDATSRLYQHQKSNKT